MQRLHLTERPRGVTVSTLDSESSDRGSNPREAFSSRGARARKRPRHQPTGGAPRPIAAPEPVNDLAPASERRRQNGMTPVGFEPTQLALVELESTPLDHSGKVSCRCRERSPLRRNGRAGLIDLHAALAIGYRFQCETTHPVVACMRASRSPLCTCTWCLGLLGAAKPASTLSCMCVCVCGCVCACVRACVHVGVWACVRACVPVCVRARVSATAQLRPTTAHVV